MNAAAHAVVAVTRADRAAGYLRDNTALLVRYGIDVEGAIDRINRAATAGDPAYVALDPIIDLGNRIARISDRLLGITVTRGGRDIRVDGPNSCDAGRDGDLLAAIGINLVDSIPRDVELYCPPAASVLVSY